MPLFQPSFYPLSVGTFAHYCFCYLNWCISDRFEPLIYQYLILLRKIVSLKWHGLSIKHKCGRRLAWGFYIYTFCILYMMALLLLVLGFKLYNLTPILYIFLWYLVSNSIIDTNIICIFFSNYNFTPILHVFFLITTHNLSSEYWWYVRWGGGGGLNLHLLLVGFGDRP